MYLRLHHDRKIKKKKHFRKKETTKNHHHRNVLVTRMKVKTLYKQQKTNSVSYVRERTIPTERPPFVGEVSANSFGERGVALSPRRITYDPNLGFLDRSRFFFFQITPQLHSRGCANTVPDFSEKFGCAKNRTWTSESVARNSAN
jgi:hypothetical protein